jgi:FixJ family two-component response regulator
LTLTVCRSANRIRVGSWQPALMAAEPRVFVLDDDPHVLRALERFLRASGFVVEAFSSPSSFLARLPYDGTACVILDLQMVFLSGKGDVPSTATAMRRGAVDFLVKPVNEAQLLDAVARALAQAVDWRERRRAELDATERLARLTRRERQVCDLVASGFLNKQIAFKLGTSEKTVKVHRGRVMRKLEVDSVAALVRLLSRVSGPTST